MAVPMLPHPLHTPLAPTIVGGVGAEATATALDMVGSCVKANNKKNLKILFAARYCGIISCLCENVQEMRNKTGTCLHMSGPFFVTDSVLLFDVSRHQLRAVQCL